MTPFTALLRRAQGGKRNVAQVELGADENSRRGRSATASRSRGFSAHSGKDHRRGSGLRPRLSPCNVMALAIIEFAGRSRAERA